MRSVLRRRAGFTAIEILVVVAIIGIFAAMAVPSWRAYQANLRLKAAARTVANAFSYARSRALSTGNRHVVVFAVDPLAPNDVCGNPIVNDAGRRGAAAGVRGRRGGARTVASTPASCGSRRTPCRA